MKVEDQDVEPEDISFESQFYENFANGQELDDRRSITVANCKEFLNQKFSISSCARKININPAPEYVKKLRACKILMNEADKYEGLFEIINKEIRDTKAQIEHFENTIKESQTQVEKYSKDKKKLKKEIKSLGSALPVAIEMYAQHFDALIDVVEDCDNLCKASVHFGSSPNTPDIILHIDLAQRKIIDFDGCGVLSDNEKEDLRQKTKNFECSAYLGCLLREIIIHKSKK